MHLCSDLKLLFFFFFLKLNLTVVVCGPDAARGMTQALHFSLRYPGLSPRGQRAALRVPGGFLFLTGCFWDNGHLYREDQPSPAPGLRCLNWLAAQGSGESLAQPSE